MQDRRASVVRRNAEFGDGGLIRTRNRDGVVRVFEDIVLGAIAEIVEVGVKGWGKGTLVHLITRVRMGLGW